MAYIGSCSDMCPEAERQARYGLFMSIFEKDLNNQPLEYAMVKEYRRSSADQKEASPEDLRTPKALSMTMDYLITYLMDDSRSTTQEFALDWYDFLWDRLRAIRKDITQQNIGDQAATVLVERCARFHVHSCYAMNRVANFDADMNKRHLNDCLQMLRQMYTDLKTGCNIFCPNEVEFQKYDILLHLSEDHLTSNVLMKTSDYRSSDDMKFIIKVFNAYSNNEYYKFFNLIESADYMTSCILSLYVNKMRLTGLKIIVAACPSRQKVLYPAELAIESLGFDGTEDLASFVEAFGIKIQEKDSKKFLNLCKDTLSDILRRTESSLLPVKSARLVENKMNGLSVGQLVRRFEGQEEQPMDESSPPYTSSPSISYQESILSTKSFENYDLMPIPKPEKPIEPEVKLFSFVLPSSPSSHQQDTLTNARVPVIPKPHQPSPPRVQQVVEPILPPIQDPVSHRQDVVATKRWPETPETPQKRVPIPEPNQVAILEQITSSLINDIDEIENDDENLLRRKISKRGRDQIAKMMPVGRFKTWSLASKCPTLKMPPSIQSDSQPLCTTPKRVKATTNLDIIKARIEDEDKANKILLQLSAMISN